jgi:hypothetical protein
MKRALQPSEKKDIYDQNYNKTTDVLNNIHKSDEIISVKTWLNLSGVPLKCNCKAVKNHIH